MPQPTGDPIDARTAADWGLVNRVVSTDQLRERRSNSLAASLRQARWWLSLCKRAWYAQIDLDQPEAYVYAQDVMTKNALAHDAQEGISAFLEKRNARWGGN